MKQCIILLVVGLICGAIGFALGQQNGIAQGVESVRVYIEACDRAIINHRIEAMR